MGLEPDRIESSGERIFAVQNPLKGANFLNPQGDHIDRILPISGCQIPSNPVSRSAKIRQGQPKGITTSGSQTPKEAPLGPW